MLQPSVSNVSFPGCATANVTLNKAFATRGVVNTVLANAGASSSYWQQAYEVKLHIKFTAE